MKTLFAIALIAGLAFPAGAAHHTDEAEILGVIDKFFEAQKNREPAVWLDIMLTDGMIMSHRERPGEDWVLNTRTVAGDMKRLTTGAAVIDERIYNPTVLVHKTIATVWAPYDIYVDERLLHCGIDVFQLLKIEGSWKISHFSYTTEPEGCEALGIAQREE